MNVHEEKFIRSENVGKQNNYENYRQILRKDFKKTCGYCGKLEKVTKNKFEIDHLVPIRLDPERECDYNNLIYCCFNCNRKKGGKFPTEDKNLLNDGEKGLIDPLSDEYNKHLQRTMEGDIIGVTNLGKYVCSRIFKFDVRPIRQICKAGELYKKKQKLEEKLKSIEKDSSKLREYLNINKALDELYDYFFEKSE